MRAPDAGGGWHALRYTLATARRVGFMRLWRAMTARNACKTCALGMGGQQGGMRNELGHFPEVCKKSLQAMAADMQAGLTPRFFASLSLKQLAAMSPRELETAGRLTAPLYAAPGATHYRVIGWDEALAKVEDKMRAVAPEASFFYFSGRSSNEAGFLLQLFARAFGTNHVNNCSYYCHQASGVGLGQAIGVGTATVRLEDVEACDAFFLIGGNPASNHPRLMTQLMKLRRRGGQVIVVNPTRETGLVRFRVPSDVRSMLLGSDIASEYVQVHAGGDIGFLMGVAKATLALGAVDEAFLGRATDGWEATRQVLSGIEWPELERAAGVDRATMERVAAVYARSQRAIFAWTMGITHHVHGVENVQWIANLALMRGMVGRAGAGLLPIRGHSNVQGMGTLGVTPQLRDEAARRLEAIGVRVPTHKGLDTMGCMDAAHAGRMQVAWALGGNLFGSNPDATYAREALSRVDLMIYLNTSLNTGHAHGLGKETLVLPVLARDEEPYATTQESMFSYVRLSDGGAARHAGPRGEVHVIADAAARTLKGRDGAVDWEALREPRAIRELIARLVPGMQGVGAIDATRREFAIPGRALIDGRFPTATGRARLFAHGLPDVTGAGDGAHAGDELTLMTVRSEGQFNTVVYEDHDLYRGQDRRDVILMHADEMARRGLAADDLVTVAAAAGAMRGIRVRPFDVRVGNALMYYPEANVLVPRTLDPQSKTPSYKAVRVTVTKETGLVRGGAGGDGHAARNGIVARIGVLLRRRRRPRLNAC
jgi:molybdopterin-dependent oxidoreductase alpha subunit